jgi:hypothetical protein
MLRIVIAGLVGGFAQYLVGFLFWGTPLADIAYSSVDDARNATVQAALAQNLPATGTYLVPWPGTPGGTTLFGQGPIATIHYNTAGFSVADNGALIAGLVLSLIAGVIVAFALARAGGFAERMRVTILFAAAFTLYFTLGQPVFNHYGWGYFIYLAISDLIAMLALGAVVAKLLPAPPLFYGKGSGGGQTLDEGGTV